jgi:hypothetical protein
VGAQLVEALCYKLESREFDSQWVSEIFPRRKRRPMSEADNPTTLLCRLSWNLGASTSWNRRGLVRPVQVLFYLNPSYGKYFVIWAIEPPLQIIEPPLGNEKTENDGNSSLAREWSNNAKILNTKCCTHNTQNRAIKWRHIYFVLSFLTDGSGNEWYWKQCLTKIRSRKLKVLGQL